MAENENWEGRGRDEAARCTRYGGLHSALAVDRGTQYLIVHEDQQASLPTE